MRILVIEDNKQKFNQIEESLNKVLTKPEVVGMGSKNSGLVSLVIRNLSKKLEPYDVVICDNYLPIYELDENDMFESELDIYPFAKEIVNEIRGRLNLKELPIIICSGDEIEECDYNYKIDYNPNISLDNDLKLIFEDLEKKGIKDEVPKSKKDFINEFMRKLNNGEFNREIYPATGDEFKGTNEEVNDKIEKYQKLLDSGIVDEITNKQKIKEK